MDSKWVGIRQTRKVKKVPVTGNLYLIDSFPNLIKLGKDELDIGNEYNVLKKWNLQTSRMKTNLEQVEQLPWHKIAISDRGVTIRGDTYSLGSSLTFNSLGND